MSVEKNGNLRSELTAENKSATIEEKLLVQEMLGSQSAAVNVAHARAGLELERDMLLTSKERCVAEVEEARLEVLILKEANLQSKTSFRREGSNGVIKWRAVPCPGTSCPFFST